MRNSRVPAPGHRPQRSPAGRTQQGYCAVGGRPDRVNGDTVEPVRRNPPVTQEPRNLAKGPGSHIINQPPQCL